MRLAFCFLNWERSKPYRNMVLALGVVGDGRSLPWIWVWHCVQLVYKGCRRAVFVSMLAGTTAFGMRGAGKAAMPGVAPQAEERRRLPQQVVGHRAVRLVADRAVLGHRRVRVGERSLLLRMALVAEQVDRLRLQVPLQLPVRIVAIGADHLAFLDRDGATAGAFRAKIF